MPSSNQTPLTSQRNLHEHNFSVKFQDWEAAIFDNAEYFAVIRLRMPRERFEFISINDAVEKAKEDIHFCLYAVTESGRSVLLDREKWNEWIERHERVC